MYPDTFNPPLLSSQERNPIWERPARKSRPQRSPSPSCSSRPSGRWRMSSMSLHWSSSSSSGHTLLEKRTGSSTCWRKTSSMRKSTPKTKETWLCRAWGSYSAKAPMKKVRKDYRWPWSCRTVRLGRSDQTGEVTALLLTPVPASWMRSLCFVSIVFPPSNPGGIRSLSLPFQRSSAQMVVCRYVSGHGLSQQLVGPWLLIGFTSLQPKHFYWLCTVWLSLIVF